MYYFNKITHSQMQQSGNQIIAVGLDILIDTEELKKKLEKYINMEKRELISEHKTGFMYGEGCKVGAWSGILTHQATMASWFAQYQNSDVPAYLTHMYAPESPRIIILVGTCQGKYFSLIVSNMTKGMQTFLHKKNANSGKYGHPILIERITLIGKPYIYYNDPSVYSIAPSPNKSFKPYIIECKMPK